MRKCLCVTIACIGVSLSSDVVCFEKRTPMKSFEDMFPMKNFLLVFADYYCKEHNIQGPGLPIRITGTDVANYLDLDPEKHVYEMVEIMADNAIDFANDYFDPRKKAIQKFWEFMGEKEYECFLSLYEYPH